MHYYENQKEAQKSELYSLLIKKFGKMMKRYCNNYKDETKEREFHHIMTNISLYFMIILKNFENENIFYEHVFKKKSKIVKQIIEIIIKSKQKDKRISKIYCNLFLDEYKEIFFKNKMEKLFILNNEIFSEKYTEGLDKYPKEIYEKMLIFLKKFDMTYDVLFSNYKHKDDNKQIGIL